MPIGARDQRWGLFLFWARFLAGAAALLLTYGVYNHFRLDPVEQISKKAER